MSDGTPLLPYITFENLGCAPAKFTFAPTSLAEVGTKSIALNRGLTQNFFDITVTEGFPAFTTAPLSQSLYRGTTKIVSIPSALQAIGDPVTNIAATLSGNVPLPGYITFSNS